MQRRFRRYDVINVIDQQDTNTTYLVGLSNKPEQNFTLKVFHKPTLLSLATRGKFLQDVNTLSRIRHPQIVSVIEGGIEQGSAYIVSDYMPGGSLRVHLDRLAPARLSFSEAITIISQLGQALAYLHEQQIVHGRLRPEHVLFDAHGQALLAGIYYPEDVWLYDKDKLIDAYKYLSPEQCRDTSGQQIGNASSDQYALCCIAYELFTGQTPFADTNILTLKEQQMDANPASLRSLAADLPPAVDEAVLMGLTKDPTQRHANISTFLAILQPFTHAVTPDPNPVVEHGQLAAALPTGADLQDKPEHEKVWNKLIYESETLPMMLEPLIAPVAKTSEQVAGAFDQRAAAAQKPPATTRTRKVPWFAVTLLTVITVSIIMYLLLATYSLPSISLVQGASTTAQTNTSSATDNDSDQNVPSTQPTPTQTSIKSKETATPKTTSTPTVVATISITPTPVPTTLPISIPTKIVPPAPTIPAIKSLYAGQLSAHAKRSGTYATAYVPRLTVSDVRIEADMASQGNSGGILFRSGYRLRIGTDGSYDLVTSSRTLATGFSPAIKTGNSASNHITIVAKGSTITIAINARSAISVNDGSYRSGYVAAMAIDFSKSTTTTCNFNIYTA